MFAEALQDWDFEIFERQYIWSWAYSNWSLITSSGEWFEGDWNEIYYMII